MNYADALNEVDRALIELQRLDQLMSRYERKIAEHVEGDEWDIVIAEHERMLLNDKWGQACTKFVIEMNSVIWHGQIVIDDWRETMLYKIARKYSACAPFYERAELLWPGVAERYVWTEVRKNGVPF